jgi:uncharacterized membrane protein YoaK (UPF0700 family)
VPPLRQPLTQALLVLTFASGVIDAASFLGLGQVFTANMTGNVVLLGFGLAGGSGLPVLAPLISLAAFVAGALLGARTIARGAPMGERHLRRVLGLETGLLVLAAALAALGVGDGRGGADVIVAVLAFVMGSRSAAVRGVRIGDLTTTVVTMTLAGIALDSRLGGGAGGVNAHRVAAVASMLLGALAGALLVRLDVAAAIGLAALLAFLTWAVFMPAAARATRGGELADDRG